MQETQHTQQTTTRTVQNQDKEHNMNVIGYRNKEDTQTFITGKIRVPPWNGQRQLTLGF